MERVQEFLNLFPAQERKWFEKIALKIDELQEIRLRINQPICVFYQNKEWFLKEDGTLTKDIASAHVIKKEQTEDIINHLCNYSRYAYEQELKQGFLTVEGGHRIGVAGKIVQEQGRVKNIKHISYLNIRISHQIIGAADKILPFLYDEQQLLNCLLISPPGGGKTTLLRDIVRQVSNGNTYGTGMNVSVVDERSEIGGSYLGVAQNDIGMRTDLLDGCSKVEGMMMLIRSMAPNMLAVDELGSKEDSVALRQVIQCGCKMIATIHGGSIDEIKNKKELSEMIEQRIFDRYILMGSREEVGKIKMIYDKDFKVCLN